MRSIVLVLALAGVAEAHSSHGGGGGHHGGGGGHHVSVHTFHGGGGWHHDGGYALIGGCDDCGYGPAPFTWWWEVGMAMRRFRGPAIASSGTIDYQDKGYAYSLASAPPRADDTASASADLRFLVPFHTNLYLGGEFEAGSLTRSTLAFSAASDTMVSFALAPTTVIGGAAVAGARMRRGWAELDGEIAGGVRAYATTANTYDNGDTVGTADLDTTARGLVELRARGVAWLTPSWTLAAEVATGALDRRDVSLAIMIGNASRPYASP